MDLISLASIRKEQSDPYPRFAKAQLTKQNISSNLKSSIIRCTEGFGLLLPNVALNAVHHKKEWTPKAQIGIVHLHSSQSFLFYFLFKHFVRTAVA